jgi:hypothetical protein
MRRMTISIMAALTALMLAMTVSAADADAGGVDADFDNDGAITELDFEILQAAYLSASGDEDFNPALDLDGDGLISGADITIYLQLSNS